MYFEELTDKDIQNITKKHKSGTDPREIAKAYDVHGNTMRAWIHRINRNDEIRSQMNISNKKIQQIQRLYNDGYPYTRIAMDLGLPKLLVKQAVILGKDRGCNKKERKQRTSEGCRRFVKNPNEPTATTVMCIHHYYDEDIHKHNMSHDEAVRDIMLELGRTRKYIEEVLKEGF